MIALSSGEAEYYGLVSGLCQALGEQSQLRGECMFPSSDIWMPRRDFQLEAVMDWERVKHIDTVFLWAQDAILTGKAKLYKKSTQEMLADLFTKPLDSGRMKMLLEKLNFHFCGGRRRHLALDA